VKRLGLPAAALAGLALVLPGAVSTTSAPVAATAPEASPLVLTGPSKVVAYTYGKGKRAYGDFGINLTAPSDAFELRTHRPDWDSPLTTVWRSPDGDVTLPAGLQTRWDGLDRFIRLTVARKDGTPVLTKRLDVCLNAWSTQRTTPDAPLRSPYPQGCPQNPFTIGSVQGIQRGWVTNLSEGVGALRVGKGRYDVTARIAPRWARALHISPADATRSYRLVVKREGDGDYRRRARSAAGRPDSARHAAMPAASTRPTKAAEGEPDGPLPDLRSLPAYGMQLSRNHKHLRFSATVWNAGDSPLLVDGFRRGSQDVMDAYQYFIDTDGNQTGYRRVGTMIWHQAKSHNHWHFEDFARYTLLRADKTEAVRSRKESFCLANTDAVDYTVDGADWQPENTDLHTSCGDRSTVSLREVLAAGSGDTYAQFRAGQAFRIDNLPNGIYYVAVEGNPDRNLVESDTGNNVALRKIKLSGSPTERRLKVFQVGVVDDSGYGYDEEH